MRQQDGNETWAKHRRRGGRAGVHEVTFRDVQWEDDPSDLLSFRFTPSAWQSQPALCLVYFDMCILSVILKLKAKS